ncbi:MAG: hypothetical protein LBF94_04330 [Puniceicoccales bacterium]|jgi:hypothetical protein|nr:hypothetical protein [Puniceicoccales bacterium]
MNVGTLDGVVVSGKSITKIQESVCKTQESEVFKKAYSVLKEGVPFYKGHKTNIEDIALARRKVLDMLQKMDRCYIGGAIYSGNGTVFTKDFAECSICFLAYFSACLRIFEQAPKGDVLILTASQMKKALKWLISIMKAVGHCNRAKQICIENVIKKLEK